ncbi:hypothetical protein GCM10027053_51580 [Intrasporangium mesophilum]
MSETNGDPARDIGEVVFERRRELGWSQERLAEESGVSDATVRKIETGDSEHVQGAKLAAVRDALSIPASTAFLRTSSTPDIEIAKELVAGWLQEIPEEQRPAAIARLTQWMYLGAPPPADSGS